MMKARLKRLIYFVFRLMAIKKNRVLIFSYYGGNYGGSPKYLSEYFVKNAPELEVVWAFTEPEKYADIKEICPVKYSSLKYYYYLSTSAFIITNYRMTTEFVKRKEQRYIQTWHSSLRLKMIEKDAEGTLPKHYIEMAKKDSAQIDLLLVGNKKSREIFERSFWYDGSYLECGTPQCDLFFDSEKNDNKVRQYFNLSKQQHILLYAPTFRKDYSMVAYDIDYKQLRLSLQERFGGDWMILLRLHPHLIHKVDELQKDACVLNATSYDDIQELLQAADVVITDYSALMFDYLLTEKPCFLYTNDYENYVSKDRKLYFSLQELPFPISYDNVELNRQIKEFANISYTQNCKKFLHSDIESWENGTACAQVLGYIRGERK